MKLLDNGSSDKPICINKIRHREGDIDETPPVKKNGQILQKITIICEKMDTMKLATEKRIMSVLGISESTKLS